MASLPAEDIVCPYCGETITVFVDDSAGEQSYIEDCQVCCRPIQIRLRLDRDGTPQLSVSAENEA
ncbi:CPXCG motif-containing cysteine-rich protein [Pseudoxanthomonas wuyuanensis]|uniref:Cysteine-rich CPXCG n=1 Tax=Pseudoxanthomonas wuyuanensis TaxID=1073196 RepID=A0A286D331_9GAMM|nr:CPXCG motif-containing cysteine-rich protein [Pseudoxanthomonas wuyuanensis]KAF1723025.1 CPXCG motif-containing cysteine-rich protein [Pseudoxanthomonas wuyuanensis]SOD53049.1 Cysteine-rich CPXCG [Pseudoxanthomonas wuyuanensis]